MTDIKESELATNALKGDMIELVITQRDYLGKLLEEIELTFNEKHFSYDRIFIKGLNFNNVPYIRPTNSDNRKSNKISSGFICSIFVFLGLGLILFEMKNK